MKVTVATRMNLGALLRWMQYGFLAAGLVCIGVYAYVWLDTELYQAYENWSFDRSLEGKRASVPGFVLDVVRGKAETEPSPTPVEERFAELEERAAKSTAAKDKSLTSGNSVVGRIEIPRLKVNAIVREGVDTVTLRRAVGHIPGTAGPGEDGNIGLAAHRDTFFRALRDVKKNDHITLATLHGKYEYMVDELKIVNPEDVHVLDADGTEKMTLVTCYPFNYVGSAPKRFIVHARRKK